LGKQDHYDLRVQQPCPIIVRDCYSMYAVPEHVGKKRWNQKDECKIKDNEAAAQKRIASEIKTFEAKKAKLVADATTAVSNVEQELNQLKTACRTK